MCARDRAGGSGVAECADAVASGVDDGAGGERGFCADGDLDGAGCGVAAAVRDGGDLWDSDFDGDDADGGAVGDWWKEEGMMRDA